MNADHAAFLRAICDNPGDDTPRLVYADFLEENGDRERAEYVRIQCEMEGLPEYSVRWRKLREREIRLRNKYKKEWAAPLGKGLVAVYFRRGFVDQMTLYPRRFLDEGERYFRTTPIRRVKLVSLGSVVSVAELVASPLLARLRGLDLEGGRIHDDEARQLAESPNVAGLSFLGLARTGVNAAGLRALLASPALPALEHLDLGMNHFSIRDAALVELAACEHLRRLRRLDVDFNPITDIGARALADSPHLANLRALGLRALSFGTLDLVAAVTATGIAALAGAKHLAGLRRLDLGGRRLGPEGAEALASGTGMTNLHELYLSAARIGDAGVRAIAASANFADLRALDLAENGITDAGAQALLDSPHLGRLEYLHLRNNSITLPLQKVMRKHFGVGVCSFSE